MLLNAYIADKNGKINMITPYEKENIDKYHLIFSNILKQTIKQLCESQKDFSDFYSDFDSLDIISLSVSSLKADFLKYLKETLQYSDDKIENITSVCCKKFEEELIINLQSILNIKLDEHVKKVIGRYYMTCDEFCDWDHTIGIIEVFMAIKS